MIRVGVEEILYNDPDHLWSIPFPKVKVSQIRNDDVNEYDVVVTLDRGLDNDVASRISELDGKIHLIMLEEKYPKEERPNSNRRRPFQTKIDLFGYILPFKGDGSVTWWLQQLSATAILDDPDESTLAYYARELMEKRCIKNDLYKTLTSQSISIKDNAINNKRVKSVRPASYDPENSEVAEKLDDKIRSLRVALKGIIKSLPPSSGIHGELVNIRNKLYEQFYAHTNIVITGIFSSGKTTLVNQLFLDGIVDTLPVDQAANTAIPLVIFVDPEIQKAQIIVNYETKMVHNLLHNLPESIENVHLPHRREFKDVVAIGRDLCQEDNQTSTEIYYAPLGDLIEICRKFSKSHSLTYDFKIVVHWSKTNMRGQSKKKNSEKRRMEFSSNEIEKFERYISERCDTSLLNDKHYFASYKLIRGVIIHKIDIELELPEKTESGKITKVITPDKLQRLQDGMISWFDPEGTYILPEHDELKWMYQAQIYDTPGIKSMRPEHDRITREQLRRSRSGDIIIVVIRVRGGVEGIDGRGMDYLRDVLRHYSNRKIVIVANVWSKDGQSLTNSRKRIEKYIKHEVNKEMTGKQNKHRASDIDVFVLDPLNTSKEERALFNHKMTNLTDHMTSRLAELYRSEFLSWINSDLDELERELNDIKTRDKKIKSAGEIAKKLHSSNKVAIKRKLKNRMKSHETNPLVEYCKILSNCSTRTYGMKEFGECTIPQLDQGELLFWELATENNLKSNLLKNWLYKNFVQTNKLDADSMESDDWFRELKGNEITPYPRKIILTRNFIKATKPLLGQLAKKSESKLRRTQARFRKVEEKEWQIGNIFGARRRRKRKILNEWDEYIVDTCNHLDSSVRSLSSIIDEWTNNIVEYVFSKKIRDFEDMSKNSAREITKVDIGMIRKLFLEFSNDMESICEEATTNGRENA